MCSCQPRNTQLSVETGWLNRKDEDGNVWIDATPDKTQSAINSGYDLSGSKIHNEGATYNTDKGTGKVSESKVKNFVSGLKNKFKNISSKTKYQQSQA